MRYMWLTLYFLLLAGLPAFAQAPSPDTSPDTKAFEECYAAAEPHELAKTCGQIDGCTAKGDLTCAKTALVMWDQKLNLEYTALLTALAEAYGPNANSKTGVNYEDSRRSLRAAQRLWIQYRDSECEGQKTRFDRFAVGQSAIYEACLAELTAVRTQYLKQEKERVLSLKRLPQIDVDESCLVEDPKFLHAPDRITAFERVSDERDAGLTGYINSGMPDQDFELHIVSSYDSSGTITVGKTDKPVVLFIQSYEPGLWKIEQLEGARLANIMTMSYKETKNRIWGAYEDTFISCSNRPVAYLGKPIKTNGNTRYMPDRYLKGLKYAQSLTGLIETSYQNIYNKGQAFSIPPDMSKMPTITELNNATAPAQIEKLSAAVTLRNYKANISNFPVESQATLEILIQAMEVGSLPVLPVNRRLFAPHGAPLDVAPIFHDWPYSIEREHPSNVAQCIAPRTHDNKDWLYPKNPDVLISDEKSQTLKCTSRESLLIGGGGNDILKSSFVDSIMNPGPGNDAMEFAHSPGIAVLERGWGNDKIDKACHFNLTSEDRERLSWPSEHYNFVVFGPGIEPDKLRRVSKNIITYPPTKDRLIMQAPCFSFVFADSPKVFDSYEDIPMLEDLGN